MKKILILTVAATITLFLSVVKADVAWEEHFDPIKATWTEPSAYWTDLAGSTAKLTENDPNNSYGDTVSETITVDVGVYSELVITSTAVDTNALYSVQIQEVGGSEAYKDAVSFVGVPGTQIVNIAALMGWSGTKSFVINVWIEGEGKSVTFDLIQIRSPQVSAGWIEDFDPIKPTWSQPSAVWNDLPGTTAKLTENDPCRTYGNSGSEVITLDVDTYNELVVVATQIDPNAFYSVQIQEVGGGGAYKDAVSFNGDPGTQVVDIAKLMGWSGVKSFIINIWIDGNSKGVTFDRLQIRQTLPLQAGWLEDFNPLKTTWIPETAYWTDAAGPNAVITENNPGAWYGVSRSEVITLDVNVYNELYVNTIALEPNCLYSIQIQEIGGAGIYKDAASYIGVPSTHIVDIAKLMGWSGTKSFRINIWIDGEGRIATFGKIEVRNGVKLPPTVFWQDHFDPIRPGWSELGAIWDDVPGTTAVLTEDNPGVSYGKVETETITADVNIFPKLTVVITDVDADAWLDVGIQEQGGMWTYIDVISTIEAPDTYTANIADITGWQGNKSFRIVMWINGNGKSVTLDMVQMGMNCGPEGVQGDYNEDCVVDFLDLAAIGQSWMNKYNRLDLKDISDNWLDGK